MTKRAVHAMRARSPWATRQFAPDTFTYPGKLALTRYGELREGFGAQLEQVFINLAAVAEARAQPR